MNKTKEELTKDKESLFRWVDANDAHLSFYAIQELRIINEQLSKL
jgi:hypothetical protein